MGQVVFNGPAANLRAIQLEGIKPQGFGGGEAVRTGRKALEPFFEQCDDRFRPGGGMVSAGGFGRPAILPAFSARLQIIGVKRIETAGRKTELFGGHDRS